jgi:hypothetical protein
MVYYIYMLFICICYVYTIHYVCTHATSRAPPPLSLSLPTLRVSCHLSLALSFLPSPFLLLSFPSLSLFPSPLFLYERYALEGYAHAHICTHTCARTHARAHTHAHAHTRTHAHTHAHIHTHTRTGLLPSEPPIRGSTATNGPR